MGPFIKIYAKAIIKRTENINLKKILIISLSLADSILYLEFF